jgi:hypothetical protein
MLARRDLRLDLESYSGGDVLLEMQSKIRLYPKNSGCQSKDVWLMDPKVDSEDL